MSFLRAKHRLILLGAGAGLAAAVLAWGRARFLDTNRVRSRQSATRSASPPLTPVASSTYLNTGPDVRYVGAQSCERCHPDTHESYHKTMMSRSMAEVDPANEPPDGEVRHRRSGHRYEIYRAGGELRQRELLTGVDGVGDVVLSDHDLKYVVGSGHFSRTYLAEADGFLVEAPATWYAAKSDWDMSPGYDQAFPEGFERAASENCLYCHAGRVEAVDGTLHKMKVHEAPIGCERCHGPGSLHVERWGAANRAAAGSRRAKTDPVDRTIVNPADLPRELAEAICQQCHLTSDAQAVARGRTLGDFRPGLPLQDFFISYRPKGHDESMTVVGHYDQLVLSRCYQESDRLTCLTCHNPHDKPGLGEKAAYYRSICLSCHAVDECRADERLRASPGDDDCTKCHMPGVPTEIVHLAFTNHRIGARPRPHHAGDKWETATAELEPWHDLSRFSDIDRRRSLGLAYFARSLDRGPQSEFCLARAAALLEEVRAEGLQEGLVAAALARIVSRTSGPQAAGLAAEALEDPNLPVEARIGTLYILAADHFRNNRLGPAIERLQELTRLRRSSVDWALLGSYEAARGDSRAVVEAFERAVAINPRLLAVRTELARLYEQAGAGEKALLQRRIGKRLQEIAKSASSPAPFSTRPAARP